MSHETCIFLYTIFHRILELILVQIHELDTAVLLFSQLLSYGMQIYLQHRASLWIIQRKVTRFSELTSLTLSNIHVSTSVLLTHIPAINPCYISPLFPAQFQRMCVPFDPSVNASSVVVPFKPHKLRISPCTRMTPPCATNRYNHFRIVSHITNFLCCVKNKKQSN